MASGDGSRTYLAKYHAKFCCLEDRSISGLRVSGMTDLCLITLLAVVALPFDTRLHQREDRC
jgi:hypothetical protein